MSDTRAHTPRSGRRVVWYRSLYARIAAGFVLTVAIVLALQASLFLWLATSTDALAVQPPGRVAAVAAAELSAALEADAALDVDAWLAGAFGGGPHRVFVVRRDERVHRSGPFEPPPFLIRAARIRLRAPAAGGPAWPAEPGPGVRPRDDRPRDGSAPDAAAQRGAGRGLGFRPRRPPLQPIVVSGAVAGVLGVLPATGGNPVLAQWGPTLVATALGLLVAGTAVMAVVVFRPVHRRLRDLEAAAAAVGAGETAVRAPEGGGDEVTSLARRFNRMAADLDARVRDLREADRSRRQLLADVSHELMTPLTAMRGYLETLALPAAVKDEPTRARYLGIFTEETLRLEAIIGDLLDLARLEGGGGTLEREPVPIAGLFDRAAARHEVALAEAGVTLEQSIAPGARPIVGDARRLEQALQNLVANAVRHTPRGGRVTLRAEPAGAGVRLVVEDTGTGIPAAHLPHVFDRFYRVDAARDTQSGGSGLGLSIVRAVIERHGGHVSAANTPGGGARFTIDLPGGDGGSDRGGRLSGSGTRA